MKRRMFLELVLLVLVFTSSLWAVRQKAVLPADVKETMEEIKSINMINSLYLTKEQKERLVEIAGEADRAVRTFEQLSSHEAGGVMALLQEMKKELEKGPQLSPGLQKRWHGKNRQA